LLKSQDNCSKPVKKKRLCRRGGILAVGHFLNFCTYQHVKVATRYNTILDVVLATPTSLVDSIRVLEPFCKIDHNIIHASLKLDRYSPPSRFSRSYRHCNYEIFNSILAEINFNFLNSNILYLIDQYISLRKTNPLRSIPTFQKSFKKIVKKLYNKYQLTKLPNDLSAYKESLKSFRSAIHNYFLNKEEQLLNIDRNSFWTYIKRKFSNPCKQLILQHNDNVITSDIDIANVFNQHFSSVFTKDNTHISCFNIEITLLDVCDALNRLNLPLFLIYKDIMKSGLNPKIWKLSHIVPIHKKGSTYDASNYRPISLTCVGSKVLERLICNKLLIYLDHGFCTKKSTSSQILANLSDWSASIDNGKIVSVVYLDLAKAFDTVSHSKLLVTLNSYGITGDLYNWVSDYIKDRYQAVYVNNTLSDMIPAKSIVPQGNCIAPLLFLLYINDITTVVINSTIYLYANDCKIYYSHGRTDSLSPLQEDLNRIADWLYDRQITLSFQKCSVLHINSKRFDLPNLFINGNLINRVSHISDLGIIMDENLDFDLQICRTIVKKSSRILNFIFRSFRTKLKVFLSNYTKHSFGLFLITVLP
uniref:Reverse transcriptase domain-containing protein n=1 Tax=Dracunculus medinensis TaxID=318479 RepID=A0A0N4UM48_DRAME